MMRYALKRAIAVVLSMAMIFTTVGCSSQRTNEHSDESSEVIHFTEGSFVDYADADSDDAFVDIQFNDIVVNDIEIENIDVEDIVVNCVEVKSIEFYEMEVVAINDEFVTLAHENFVSYYGVDFDLGQFLKDVAIGSTVVLVYVTLTTVGGPVGTFFGAVVVSEISKSALLIGAAIDAAVSAYKAYEEGGDASYIVGHMLNGVADGYRWGAMLAPITGVPSGIKALRATKAIMKLLPTQEISEKAASSLIKKFADIIRKSSSLKDYSDDALKKLYKEMAGELPEEITEELFIQAIKNKSAITTIIRQFNPFNVSSEVTKALQQEFWEKAGKSHITEQAGKEIINGIKDKSIKSLNDIGDESIAKYIKENMYSFVQCYGKSLSNDFIDSCLKDAIGDGSYAILKEVVTQKSGYIRLVEKMGLEATNAMLERPDKLILISLRFGSDNLSNLRYAKQIYSQLSRGVDVSDEKYVLEIVDGIINKTYKNLDAVKNINATVADNLVNSREAVSVMLSNMKLKKSSSELMDSIVTEGLVQLGIDEKVANDIVTNRLSKAQIIDAYGKNVYEELLSQPCLMLDNLSVQASVNYSLIKDILEDTLASRGIKSDAIEKILNGTSLNDWGLSNSQIADVGSVVAEYYRIADSTTYDNYVKEYAEARGKNISAFLAEYKEDYTMTNARFAGGIMEPSGVNAEFIKMKYGDIYMTDYGFAVFDKYAVARIEISDLTGIDNDDIAMANIIHHGIRDNIKGYTWHHLEDGKTLILIPTELHEAYKHTGGAALLRAGMNGA